MYRLRPKLGLVLVLVCEYCSACADLCDSGPESYRLDSLFFSQTRLTLRLAIWRACTLLEGISFRRYFCIVLQLGHPATHPPKITKIVQRDHPQTGALNARG